jgi:hypothetical protein
MLCMVVSSELLLHSMCLEQFCNTFLVQMNKMTNSHGHNINLNINWTPISKVFILCKLNINSHEQSFSSLIKDATISEINVNQNPSSISPLVFTQF